MANTLAANIGDAERAAEIIGQELAGFIPGMSINAGSQAVALNGTVKSLTTEDPTINSSATPAMTIPEGDDQEIGEKSMTVSQVASARMNITGEEERDIDVNHDFETVNGNRYLRAMRKITDTIEAHCGTVLKNGASRAYGTAGTTPFASDHKAINHVRQILVDNGFFAPGEVSLVINSLAGTNLRNLSNLYKVNEGGNESLLRQGVLQDISGIMIRESAGVASHTKGTGTSYAASAAAAVGATTLSVDTGSGTVVAGDILTADGDTVNKYVVGSGIAAAGDITLNAPGVREAIADTTAIAVGANYSANVMFHRACAELVARPLAVPSKTFGGNGDAADVVFQVQDPRTGLTFEFRVYGGWHKALMTCSVVYQAKVWETAGVATLLG
jgi:hypothetical protein